MTYDGKRRIVVTGIGLWTPLGSDRESSWKGLIEGHHATRQLESPYWTLDRREAESFIKPACTSSFVRQSESQLTKATDIAPMYGAPFFKMESCRTSPSRSLGSSGDTAPEIEPLVSLGLKTTEEAVADAGLLLRDLYTERTGVVYGTSKGGFHTFTRLFTSNQKCQSGPSFTEPDHAWLDVFPDAASSAIARHFRTAGPTLCPVLACATGLAACSRAADLIRDGLCDVVLAGSSDASLQPAILGSFRRLGVMARATDHDPDVRCRPFDRDRTGFLVGEGAACLVFESLEHALSRNASWYGEWIASRMLTDPTGLTQLDQSGESLLRLLNDLKRDVPVRPDYINLHGTATIQNDLVEGRTLRRHLGSDARAASCSSLKGAMGHLLGAAGSVELAASFLALRDQIVPPTANLQNRDPECDLDLTPREARSRSISHILKLSLGFGGHLTAARLARCAGDGDRTRHK